MTKSKKDTEQEPKANDGGTDEKPDPSVRPPERRLAGELKGCGAAAETTRANSRAKEQT